MTQQKLSVFTWSIADLLRGDFKQSEYGRVMLPFMVLRRQNCVLEPYKANPCRGRETEGGGALPPRPSTPYCTPPPFWPSTTPFRNRGRNSWVVLRECATLFRRHATQSGTSPGSVPAIVHIIPQAPAGCPSLPVSSTGRACESVLPCTAH